MGFATTINTCTYISRFWRATIRLSSDLNRLKDFDRIAVPVPWRGKSGFWGSLDPFLFADADPAFQFARGSQQGDARPLQLEIRIL